jgi:hypothetical protein
MSSMKTDPAEDLLGTRDVAEMLDITTDGVRHLARNGKLPSLKTPSGVHIFRRSVVERVRDERRANRREAEEFVG